MMRFSTLLIIYSFFANCYGQSDDAHSIIDTLCSPRYDGRGYVNHGEKKAADFIVSKMKNLGIKNFHKSYFQNLFYDVNTFPDSMRVNIDGKDLITGEDYLIDPISGSAEGTFATFWIDSASLISQFTFLDKQEHGYFKDKAVVLDGRDYLDKKSAREFNNLAYEFSKITTVFVINDQKFTWWVSLVETDFPIIQIKSKFISKEAVVYVNIHNGFIEKYPTQNIVGFIKGTDKKMKKKYIVFTAHYDHLGRMGANTYIPGANDNASGVSMLLELMKYYKEHPSKYSIVMIFFTGEEAGLLGSKYFSENPLFPLKNIVFLTNLDLIGTGEQGIQVVNSTVFTEQFARLDSINNHNKYQVKVKKRGKAANSDHYWFTEKGVPSFFIYTLGGIKAYHDIYDKSETLPLTAFDNVYHLLIDFVSTF